MYIKKNHKQDLQEFINSKNYYELLTFVLFVVRNSDCVESWDLSTSQPELIRPQLSAFCLFVCLQCFFLVTIRLTHRF